MNKKFIGCCIGAVAVIGLSYCSMNTEEYLTKKAYNYCSQIGDERKQIYCDCRIEVGKLFFSGSEYNKYLKLLIAEKKEEIKKMVYSLEGTKANFMAIEYDKCLDDKTMAFIQKMVEEEKKGKK